MSQKKLDLTREKIAGLKKEIAEVRAAGLPADVVERHIREQFSAPVVMFNRLQKRINDCIDEGRLEDMDDLIRESHASDELPLLALGAAISAFGMDRFISAGKGSKDAGLRLTVVQREERLAKLRRERYEAELEEEALVQELGVERRPDADPAAVLGIPLEDALEAGLLGAA